jgi:hypothetical protein
MVTLTTPCKLCSEVLGSVEMVALPASVSFASEIHAASVLISQLPLVKTLNEYSPPSESKSYHSAALVARFNSSAASCITVSVRVVK